MVNQWFTSANVSAADSDPRTAFILASSKRLVSIKGRLLCPGVSGAAYEHLYGCAPQGILHPSDIAAGCSEDACLESEHVTLMVRLSSGTYEMRIGGGGGAMFRDT